MYKLIESNEDIEEFMSMVNNFHDTCIKEIRYVSGSYVDESGAMYPLNTSRSVKIIFDSQGEKYKSIELEFDLINKLNLEPRSEKYGSVLLAASLIKVDSLFYWSEWAGFKLEEINKVNGTWISAEIVKWKCS